MDDWQPTTIGQHVQVKHGFAFKGEYFGDLPPGDVLVTPGNFAIGGGFQLGKLKYYNGPALPDYILSPGDILVTMTDLSKAGDTLGYSAKIPNDGRVYLHNQRIGKLLGRGTGIELDFFHWLMRWGVYRDEILSSCTGSTVKHTSPTRIEAFKFRMPPSSERSAICGLLNSLDDKIELNRRMNETLEAMAQAIFRDWFVDFGPTRRKLAGITDPVEIMGGLTSDPTRAAELADLFPITFGDNGLPEGWEAADLSAVADLNSESWSASRHPDSIEYVDLANTKWGRIECTAIYTWSDAPSRARRVVRSGDTIIGTVRPGNGSFAYIGIDGLTASTGFAVLRPKSKPCTEFVACAAMARENIDRLAMLADGGAYPAVRPEQVLATSITLAPMIVIASFSELTRDLWRKLQAADAESQTLAAIRDLLLPKLMSGEIRLRDVEALVQDQA